MSWFPARRGLGLGMAMFAGLVLLAGLVSMSRWAAAQNARPRVSFETTLGTIVFELDREHAPLAVANFLRYAREGHFTGTVFYRVVPGFVVQAGSFDAAGKSRGVLPSIPLETATTPPNTRGTITMAHDDDPDSARAEFFINLVDNKGLDRKPDDMENKTGFSAFGRVAEGMDVVEAMTKLPLKGGVGPFPDAAPMTPVVIMKVAIAN